MRRSVPVILQMEAAECGVAALAMVLGHFGRHLPLERLRHDCKASRDGVTVAGLTAAARLHGLEAVVLQRDIEGLAALPLPQILFWRFDHFVVLERIGRGSFTIVDPSEGRRQVDHLSFSRDFTGVTLAFGRGTLKATRPLPSAVWTVVGQALAFRRPLGTVVAAAMAALPLSLLLPGFTRAYVDDVLIRHFDGWLIPLLLGMVATACVRSVLSWIESSGRLRAQTAINAALSARFVWRLLHMPPRFFQGRSAGELSSRVQHAGTVAGMASGTVAGMATDTMALAAAAAAMLAINPAMTLVVAGFAGVSGLILKLVARRMLEASLSVQLAAGTEHGTDIQAMAVVEELRASGDEDMLFHRLVDVRLRSMNAEQSGERLKVMLGGLIMLTRQGMSLAVFAVGGLAILRGDLTFGELIAFQMLAELFAAPLERLTGAATMLQTASSAVVRLQEVTAAPTALLAAGGAGQRLPGTLCFEGVTFLDARGEPILKDVTFSLDKPGELVAVTGLPGSGKSLLLDLMVGATFPNQGQVRLGGKALAGLDDQTLRKTLGYADRSPHFAAGTLTDAVTLWCADIPSDAVARALADAELHDLLERRGGVAARIAAGGSDLSGGERQRLAIARAVSSDPAIIVLDDATSALDHATERRVLENLRRRGATVVVASVRNSVLAMADRVVWVDRDQTRADAVLTPAAA